MSQRKNYHAVRYGTEHGEIKFGHLHDDTNLSGVMLRTGEDGGRHYMTMDSTGDVAMGRKGSTLNVCPGEFSIKAGKDLEEGGIPAIYQLAENGDICETEAGGEMIAYVCDTTGIFNPLVTTLNPDFGGAIWTSDFYLVTENDVNSGMVVIDVPEFELTPNAYYIVIEMYSNGLESDILIGDDTSVAQPWFASLVFYPSDQTWYSNPNAASIHIGLDGFENSLDETLLSGIQYFPNPNNGVLEITSQEVLTEKSNITIYNILGGIVLEKEVSQFGNQQIINLEKLVPGSYIIELKNERKTSKEILIIE